MDAFTPLSSSDLTSISRRDIFYYIIVAALFAAIFGGTLWYANQDERQIGSSFDPARQFVPKGAASLDIDRVLSAFNFPRPLPFFDERNVVQSLNIQASSSSPSTQKSYISYRVFGQNISALRDAYHQYFNRIGWATIESASYNEQTLFFRAPGSSSVVQILFLTESPETASIDRSIVVTISTI